MLARMWSDGTFPTLLWGASMGTDILENALGYIVGFHIFILYDPETLIPGIYANEMSIHLYKRQAYSIIINKISNWKQPLN